MIVDAETMQKTEKKNLKQATGVHAQREITKGVTTKKRGMSEQIVEVLKQFDIHGERREDPWVITAADRRPVETTHGEPIDEAREPAREYHASPEVPVGVDPLGRTSAGAVTQAVQHEERRPPEREQVVAPSWRQTNETRE